MTLPFWVFEDKVLRRIFGIKVERATGGIRKSHSGELHNLYSQNTLSSYNPAK
jgi:hypothetical protein